MPRVVAVRGCGGNLVHVLSLGRALSPSANCDGVQIHVDQRRVFKYPNEAMSAQAAVSPTVRCTHPADRFSALAIVLRRLRDGLPETPGSQKQTTGRRISQSTARSNDTAMESKADCQF